MGTQSGGADTGVSVVFVPLPFSFLGIRVGIGVAAGAGGKGEMFGGGTCDGSGAVTTSVFLFLRPMVRAIESSVQVQLANVCGVGRK